MQNSRAAVLVRPDNAVARAVRRNTRGRAGILERRTGLTGRRARQPRIRNAERPQRADHRPVINRMIEIRRHTPDAARYRSGNLLVDVVRAGIELSHIFYVHDVCSVLYTWPSIVACSTNWQHPSHGNQPDRCSD